MNTAESRKPEVLIIDDESQIRRLLRVTLEAEEFAVREAECGQVGLNEIALHRPDLVVLDLGLPDIPGVEVLRRLREWTRVPVLILSVLGHEDDKVTALDEGADDYLTKPFNNRELVARLRVMQRRVQTHEVGSVQRYGAVEIDFNRRIVTKRGEEIALTAKEYALLRLLVSHNGKVLTHRQVLLEIWGPGTEGQTHYLRVYLDRLRHKLEDDPKQPRFFKTVLGVGYRFVAE
jgi:two-component system KDP operon response regulator KdpE